MAGIPHYRKSQAASVEPAAPPGRADDPSQPMKQGWSPDDYLGWGFMVAFLGGLVAGGVYFASTDLGVIVLCAVAFIAWLLLSIGVVAKGVEVGMRARR